MWTAGEGRVNFHPLLSPQGETLHWVSLHGCCGTAGTLPSEKFWQQRERFWSAAICMASEDSSVQFSFPKLFSGGKSSYLVPLPQEQGRQVRWDEFRTPQCKLPEVASEQGLYQAANGVLQEGLKAPPVRMLKSKQENGPWKWNVEISLTLDWE